MTSSISFDFSTFVCPTEIIAFSDRYCDFEKLNTGLIAASVDSHFSHLAWVKTPRNEGGLGRLQIPLLSDITKSISRDYGVLLENTGFALRLVNARFFLAFISNCLIVSRFLFRKIGKYSKLVHYVLSEVFSLLTHKELYGT